MKFFNIKHISSCFSFRSFLVIGAALTTFASCKENISDEAYYGKRKDKDQTIEYHLENIDNLSLIKQIFSEVKLGLSENASSVGSALAARGNYTVFAPNNEAVIAYIDSVTNGQSSDISALDSLQKVAIALNCIIDNEDQAAYELADFPSNGLFARSNLKDRRISCKDVDNQYILNDDAKVVESNIEASNGMLHVIDHVIVPSESSIASLMMDAPNLKIMSKLLVETGYYKPNKSSDETDILSLNTQAEEQFERDNLSHAGELKSLAGVGDNQFTYQTKRPVGFTAFVETDDVLQKDWSIPTPNVDASGNITNWSEILSALKAKCDVAYPGSSDANDLKSKNNSVHKFLQHHIMDGKIVLEDRSAVHHWNEYSYSCGESYKTKSSELYTVDVWDYYTMRSGSLIKITQVANDKNYYINRIGQYNTTWSGTNLGDYTSTGVKTGYDNDGSGNGLNILVSNKNIYNGVTYKNDGANGYYFPINHVLVNGESAKDALSSERMRIDFTTFFPEFLSADVRGSAALYFPQGYFSGITNESTDCKLYYLQEGYCGKGFGWKDYQGDEFIATGLYDLTVKLPRVPKTGRYEVRLACSNNSLRGMVQIYLGDSPQNMLPTGLPIDQRETTDIIPGDPWKDDQTVGWDQETCLENDRYLRNQGYMKGPQYFHKNGKDKPGTPVRNIKGTADDAAALRRIITTQKFDENKTYYMRFKSAIPDYANSQLFLDYIEFVPSSVYNGTTPEDIW